jgi:hypothetical protein
MVAKKKVTKVKTVKINWENLREKVKATDKEVLKKAIMVDGHTIYDAKKFTDAGLDAEVVEAFVENMASGQGKEAIFDNAGNPVHSMKGVYGLSVLHFIAGCFDVTTWKMGRGSQAQHLIEQLMEKWA